MNQPLHDFSPEFLDVIEQEFKLTDPGYNTLRELIFRIKHFENAEPDYKNPRKYWNRDAELLKLIDFLNNNKATSIHISSKAPRETKGITINNELAIQILIDCIQSNFKEPETPEAWIKRKQKIYKNFNPSIEQAKDLLKIELSFGDKDKDKAHYLYREDIKRYTKKGNTGISANYAFVMDFIIQRIRGYLKKHSAEPVIKKNEYYFVGLVLKEAGIMFTDKPDLTPEDCKSFLQHWFDKLEKSKIILTINDF